LKTRFFPTEKF